MADLHARKRNIIFLFFLCLQWCEINTTNNTSSLAILFLHQLDLCMHIGISLMWMSLCLRWCLYLSHKCEPGLNLQPSCYLTPGSPVFPRKEQEDKSITESTCMFQDPLSPNENMLFEKWKWKGIHTLNDTPLKYLNNNVLFMFLVIIIFFWRVSSSKLI